MVIARVAWLIFLSCVAGACSSRATGVLVHLSAPGTTHVTSLEISVTVGMVDGGAPTTQRQTLASPTLPSTIRIFLADAASTEVTVELGALDDSGGAFSATATTRSVAHELVEIDVVLQPASGELHWTAEPSGTTNNLFSVWGLAPDRYAVGSGGTLLHASGTSAWSAQSSGTTATLLGVGGDSGHVFVVGALGCNLLASSNRGAVWSKVDHCAGAGGSDPIEAVTVDTRGRVLAVGDSYRCYVSADAGTGWQEVCGGLGGDFYGVAFQGEEAVVVGAGGAATYSSSLVAFATAADTGTDAALRSAFSDVTSVYAVGGGGTIVRYDGKAWSRIDSGVSTDLNGGWSGAPRDLYVVGAGGLIRHSTDGGATWTTQARATSVTLRAIWGAGPREVYAVGDSGVILRGR